MYLSNKYTKWYYSIVSNAQSRNLPPEQYSERHHIIPKSMGGNNDNTNVVSLTAREHLICHLLLPRMTTGVDRKKMLCAAWWMVHRITEGRSKRNSRLYAKLREEVASMIRERNSNPSPETRQKMRDSAKSRECSEETRERLRIASLGHEVAPETRIKIGLGNKGKKRSPEVNLQNSIRGANISDETRSKMSAAKRGKKRGFWWTNGIRNLAAFECPGEGWIRGKIKIK